VRDALGSKMRGVGDPLVVFGREAGGEGCADRTPPDGLDAAAALVEGAVEVGGTVLVVAMIAA
jgi:hypothetical protein